MADESAPMDGVEAPGQEEAKDNGATKVNGNSTPAATADGPVNMEAVDGQGTTVASRDAKAAEVMGKEGGGSIYLRTVHNDGTRESCEVLVALKNIFAKQLPKMPREYIVRLVFDRRHKSIALCRDKHVIGGICYRPYYEQKFAEIAFCAIKSEEQVRGFGTRLMNHLKECVKRDGIVYFLTYADNYAIGYFRKQGFSKNLTMPKSQWHGFIKDYDGAHLMECFIHPSMNYLDVRAIVQKQREYIHSRIMESAKSQVVYPGLDCFRNGKRLATPLDIPGIKEAGWTQAQLGPASQRDADREKASLTTFLQNALMHLENHRAAWPFKEPVSLEDAPDYLSHITDPIDLSLIRQRIDEGDYYRSKEMLHADLMRMTRNCKTYNNMDTPFYSAALELEGVIRSVFKRVNDEEGGGGGKRGRDVKGKGSEAMVVE